VDAVAEYFGDDNPQAFTMRTGTGYDEDGGLDRSMSEREYPFD